MSEELRDLAALLRKNGEALADLIERPTYSDNLRQRIVAALGNSLQNQIPSAVDGGANIYINNDPDADEWTAIHLDKLADAVIAELKREECGGDLCECRQCRVIRDMQADDD